MGSLSSSSDSIFTTCHRRDVPVGRWLRQPKIRPRRDKEFSQLHFAETSMVMAGCLRPDTPPRGDLLDRAFTQIDKRQVVTHLKGFVATRVVISVPQPSAF